MLWILIPSVCAMLVLLGVALSRVAALSDAAEAARTAALTRLIHGLEYIDLPTGTPAEQIPVDPQYGSYRATG